LVDVEILRTDGTCMSPTPLLDAGLPKGPNGPALPLSEKAGNK